METPQLRTSDIQFHVVTFGIDVFPPIELDKERTRLHLFYEQARERWAGLFDRLLASQTEFQISRDFRQKEGVAGPSTTIGTFALTPRGPVFTFPLRLTPPIGEIHLGDRYLDQFREILKLFMECLPGHDALRIGLVRDLIFETGTSPCISFITGHREFAGASLTDGQTALVFRDAKYNHHVWLEPGNFARATQLPGGQTVTQPTGFGMKVRLDVNFAHITGPLKPSDIQEMIERATSLYPGPLLEFINRMGRSC